MAMRMKEYEVVCPVGAPFTSPDYMMAVPSGNLGDSLVAHRTESFLFLPQMQESPFAGQVSLCFYVETLLKVRFPSQIIRICLSLDGSMPLDFHIGRSSQMHELPVSFPVLDFSCEHPVIGAFCCEVFLLHPGRAFSWVSPSGPPPQLLKDRMIHRVKDVTAGPKSVIVGPSSYDGVELDHDLSRRAILVFFDNSSDLL